jgi:hypothetical protein
VRSSLQRPSTHLRIAAIGTRSGAGRCLKHVGQVVSTQTVVNLSAVFAFPHSLARILWTVGGTARYPERTSRCPSTAAEASLSEKSSEAMDAHSLAPGRGRRATPFKPRARLAPGP